MGAGLIAEFGPEPLELWVSRITGPLFLAGGIGLAANYEFVEKMWNKEGVPVVLSLFYEKGEWDEAVIRSFREATNKRLQQLIMALMYVSLVSLVFFSLFTARTVSDNYVSMLISLIYTPIFHYRLGKALDPWSVRFESAIMGRKIYLFYPFTDEHTEFQRENRLGGRKSLTRKRELLETAYYQELLSLIIVNSALALVVWWANQWGEQTNWKASERGLRVLVTASLLTVASKANLGPVNLIDKFNRYVAISKFERPLKSIKYPFYFDSSYADWESQTNIGVPHYHAFMGPLKPLAQVFHNSVFLPARKMGYTNGASMVFTTAAQLAMLLTAVIATQGPSNKETYKTMALFTLNHMVHALYQYVDQDIAVDDFRDWIGDGKTKGVVFSIYKIVFGAFDFLTFSLPATSYFLMPLA